MGIGDRDYMRPGSRFAFLALGVIPTIIAINMAVFIAWQTASPRLMLDHFTVSAENLAAGRWWTLLTAAFSHIKLFHILLNMLVLYGFGRMLEERWGTRRFLLFYLVAAVISSFAHPLTTWLGWPDGPALGASGALAALFMCFAIYYPHAKILFMFVLPLPAWLLVALLAALDLYGLIDQRSGGQMISSVKIGHAVHLAGSLCGLAYVFLIERGRLSPGGGRRRRRVRILHPEESPWRSAAPPEPFDPDERRLDDLLDKVSRGGLDSLSVEERDTLERISARRRQRR